MNDATFGSIYPCHIGQMKYIGTNKYYSMSKDGMNPS